jgi:hypothetical protein
LIVESAENATDAFRPASASFDAATQELKTNKVGADTGFYRLRSDREDVSITVSDSDVRLGVSID